MNYMMKTIFALFIFVAINAHLMAQEKYAFLVGVSKYSLVHDTGWEDIHGANDVVLLKPILEKQGFKTSTLTEEKATFDNIIKGLSKLEKTIKSGNIVYLHFSMHGQPFDDAISSVKGDENDGWDEALIPIDAAISYNNGYTGSRHIIDDDMNVIINRIRTKIGKTGYLYVAIDACHSGRSNRGGFDEPDYVRGVKRGFSKDNKPYIAKDERPTYYAIESSTKMSPVVYLEACRGKELNAEMEFNGVYHGPMSYFIAHVLSKTAIGTNANWVIEVKELMDAKGPQNQSMVIEQSKD